ncbi:hypothetical protein [Flavihumibacter petaseus]|uniref:Uncharacterized protein n=1 Tax=Flavihumibacter petaseus NBRC 106054 TaxID=1220578 RepID=A0A0E9MZ94_9BACT|nr:hypothetical protein [Flavihumibacter petaseus]GAO42415.1 hypothetical protein FPE01S_01_14300 [Flavihumibacter petaseus NBRC 106054]
MENTIKQTIEGLVDHAGDIADTYYQLSVVKATETAGKTAAASMMVVLVMSFAIVILAFVGLGFAWWIGETLQNMKAGFFIVAGCYALVLVLVLLFRRNAIIPMVKNAVVRSVYEK